jgi:hypothetical protein
VTNFLHHEIASEAAGRLDNDHPHAVTLDPLEHAASRGASDQRARWLIWHVI